MGYFGCWNFEGAKSHGYGYIYVPEKRKPEGAHKVAWRELVGPIPDEHELHHVCRNPACYNPAHLEAVSIHAHPDGAAGERRAKTHCKNGHEYTAENTMWCPDARCTSGFYRKCRTCWHEYARASTMTS